MDEQAGISNAITTKFARTATIIPCTNVKHCGYILTIIPQHNMHVLNFKQIHVKRITAKMVSKFTLKQKFRNTIIQAKAFMDTIQQSQVMLMDSLISKWDNGVFGRRQLAISGCLDMLFKKDRMGDLHIILQMYFAYIIYQHCQEIGIYMIRWVGHQQINVSI